MKQHLSKTIFPLLILVLIISACITTNQNQALQNAQTNAANAIYYVPKNAVELRNYNWRQEIADNPSLILWCTFFPANPNAPMITVPILGKLTSGAKRPFPQYTSSSYENPGADGMYGSSGEYRFGFGPTGKYEYYDFYGVETFCTTVPLTYQREKTIIVMEKDPTLVAASVAAEEALKNGDSAKANQILLDAIHQIQGGK
jgi:hypothetical protein